MLLTLIRIAWLNLKRDRVAQALTFLLPIIFFSIFAAVLGNQRDTASRVRVAVVDEDRSEFSQKLVAALRQEGGLRVRTHAAADGTGPELTRAAADTLVKNGAVPGGDRPAEGTRRGPPLLGRPGVAATDRGVAGGRLRSDRAAGRAGTAAESRLHRRARD